MDIYEFWDKYSDLKTIPCVSGENFINIPVNTIKADELGAARFNEIYQDCLSLNLRTLIRTAAGGLQSYVIENTFGYDVRTTNTVVELTICCKKSCRIQWRSGDSAEDEKHSIYGRQAFNIFKDKCAEMDIDLNSYAEEDGAKHKDEIEKPLICYGDEDITDKIIRNAHHVDFHNSYPAGLCNTHPEFTPVVSYFYDQRNKIKEERNKYQESSADWKKLEKENQKMKGVLNLTIGFMQSIPCTKARWAALSRDAINDNNMRVRGLADRIRASGGRILAYNTDGFWYDGPEYHGEGEGDGLGEWSNDHRNCMIRFKSPGAYEFIEDDKYYPVVRGMTRLDKTTPRSKWSWGDIYQDDCEIIIFKFLPGVGIIKEN